MKCLSCPAKVITTEKTNSGNYYAQAADEKLVHLQVTGLQYQHQLPNE